MTDPANLLANATAPLPRAALIETEVRTEGFFALEALAHPNWAARVLPSSQLAEWRCVIEHRNLLQLHQYLKEVLPSGKPRQQIMNESLEALEIGSYLGTFVEQGQSIAGGVAVRVLFAYRFSKHSDLKSTNRAIHDLLTTSDSNHQEAASSLKRLRAFWKEGTQHSETFLQMLTQAIKDPAETHPFSAADR